MFKISAIFFSLFLLACGGEEGEKYNFDDEYRDQFEVVCPFTLKELEEFSYENSETWHIVEPLCSEDGSALHTACWIEEGDAAGMTFGDGLHDLCYELKKPEPEPEPVVPVEPVKQSFCKESYTLPPDVFHISTNLNTEFVESLGVCYEAGTPGAPTETPGEIRNILCNGLSCISNCVRELQSEYFNEHGEAPDMSEAWPGQVQYTQETQYHQYQEWERCRIWNPMKDSWDSWTEWE